MYLILDKSAIVIDGNSTHIRLKYYFGGLVSLEKYLVRLKPGKWPRDETSLVVSNLGCRH